MYRVTFGNIDRKILRTIKELKSKNGHTLHAADQLLKKVHETIPVSTKLTIVINDLENELDYNFEDISINPKLSAPKLMGILEEDILSSGHEEGQKILNELENQYQLELLDDTGTDGAEQRGKSRTAKTNKKGLNLLGRFKKGVKSSSLEEKEKAQEFDDDFIGLDEPETYQSAIKDDFSEMEKSGESFNSYDQPEEIEPSEIHSIDLRKSDLDDIEEEGRYEEKEEVLPFSMNSESTGEFVDNDSMIIDDIHSENEWEKAEREKEIPQKKNEKIIFPDYDGYVDLSSLNHTIQRNKERFEKTQLAKYLGVNTLAPDKAVSDLDAMKINYILTALEESKFVLLKDFYLTSVDDIKDKIQNDIAQEYDKAMSFDYQQEASKRIEEDIRAIYDEGEASFLKIKQEEETSYLLKLEKFEHEQEKALDEFKRKQGLEKAEFVKDLDTKMSARIGLYKDSMQTELTAKKEERMDEKMYELKYLSINQLTETKRQAIRQFDADLNNVVDETWINTQAALDELKKDIETHIPKWKNELEAKRKQEAEKREEQRRQEELELEKQKIELQRKQLELKTKGVKEEHSLSSMLEKKLSENDLLEKIDRKLSAKENVPAKPLYVKRESQNKSQSKHNKAIIIGAAVALLTLGGGMITEKLVSDNNNTAALMQMIQNQQLSNKMDGLQQQVSSSKNIKTTDTKESLDTLLNNKDYEKAMALYKDSNSAKKIEDALYSDKALATLVIFNKTNNTAYGPIDEAVLSKDVNKVMDLYQKMSDADKANLSDARKSVIALFLFQNNQKDLANSLLAMK